MAETSQRPVTQKARALKPGATIGIVSPSGPVPPEALAEGVARVEAWGYRAVVGQHAGFRRGYLAGLDHQRAEDFNALWADPAVDGILCARGGYGAMRILDHIDWNVVRDNPKFFCGFSDITALHAVMERRAGLVTFHGPMAAALGSAAHYNAAGLRRAMAAVEPLGLIPLPEEGEDRPVLRTVRSGVAEGQLCGGNLSLLCALMGTPWEPDFAGRILLIEDVDEAPYRMDRMLMQLLLAGKLQRAAGILFGHSPTCECGVEGKPSLTLFEVLEDLLVPLGIPILYGYPCGHSGYRVTVPFGVQARLDATGGALTILEPALI